MSLEYTVIPKSSEEVKKKLLENVKRTQGHPNGLPLFKSDTIRAPK